MNRQENDERLHKASYFKIDKNGHILCQLCPHRCVIQQDDTGRCRVRKNIDGSLYSLNYGQVSAEAIDPIEKKPLYHYYPNSTVYSIGTYGCNLHCLFCQNWHISQGKPPLKFLSPEEVVQEALLYRDTHNCIGVAYTYSEPVVWYEYVLDTARAAVEKGLKNVFVSNGFIEREPLEELIPLMDAMNIDLKAFTEGFYDEMCGGRLEPVKETIQSVSGKCHLELTILLIPGKNDSCEELERITDWVASIDHEIPVHFSRYYPQYKLTIPPTSVETMEKAYRIARKKLDYVYLGNVPGHKAVNTYCPSCGAELIGRTGFTEIRDQLENEKCQACDKTIRIISERT